MAGNDEPPYLNIGTDVSAKYKGAFCEAKIKKAIRVVKCKVTFKNNLGSFMVTDDLIKGPLRMGAEVEAKHPEKNVFLEAVINKLQDYSQYTVVFDDGDETTLRRTSLCLKSGRHFAESPTLDQFPLTNPEHFGTPVIGAGKYKRKRRSTMNSSMDYDSSDEDSFPKKLKAIRIRERDPELGKVVAVDFGDRRKRENWYPGLVFPHPPQSPLKLGKDELMIRSFKDGKYYQVPRRDTREFTRDLIPPKLDNNSLKQAIEKALVYIEKEELPSHWDRALFMGLDNPSADSDSQDSDLDTSDDEPSEDKDRFVAQLYKFMDERGTPINKAPTVSNKDLNLHKLFKIMHKMGGFNKVTNQNKWKTVYLKMGLPQSNLNGPNQLKSAYKRYLQSFEDFYRKLGCTMVNNSRSTRGRHRSDRNFILTRTRDREATASPKGRSSGDIKDVKDKTDKKEDKKVEESPRLIDKKDIKQEEEPKNKKIEEKQKSPEKKKLDKTNTEDKEEKQKKEERPRLVRSQSLNKDKKISIKEEDKKDIKTEKARTREDARKEKNESPEKKGTRSSLKIEMEKKEKEESTKEKKDISPSKKDKKEEKTLKDIKDEKLKDKKDEKTPKERKFVKDKKIGEKSVKDKNENQEIKKEKNDDKLREKKDSKEEKIVKGRKEDAKMEEKSPMKKKLDRLAKEKKEEKVFRPRRENKSPLPDNKKNDEADNRSLIDEKPKIEVEIKKEEAPKEKIGPKLRERPDDIPCSEEGDVIETKLFDDKDASQDEMDRKGPGPLGPGPGFKLKDDPDEPPNKVKRRSLKPQDDKDLEDAESDSDDDDPDSMKDKDFEIELGNRVKVKYGRGRMKKVYDAKVLKIQTDGTEKRYFVHYNGWNNRYDEWVRRSFIVALINPDSKDNKQPKEAVSPSVKRIDRGRPPGPIIQSKPARKNSTSSTNSSLSSSRATRSDKKNLQSPLSSGLGPRKRVRRRSGVTGLTDTSQDSDSDNEENDLDDLDDVGDADVEDNVNTQNDSCFKEELFSDDEEKEKLEDVKRDDISELEKSITTEENTECVKDSVFDSIKKETDAITTFDKVEIPVTEEPKKLKEDSCDKSIKDCEKSEKANESIMITQTIMPVKVTVKEITAIPPENLIIQQPETSSQKPQSEGPKTLLPEKIFKTHLSEKFFKSNLTEKVLKGESQEKILKAQISEVVPPGTSLSGKIYQLQFPETISDNESKIQIHERVLKIQLPEKRSSIKQILTEKSEKIPAEKPSELNQKYFLPDTLTMSNIKKSLQKSADVTPITISSETKSEKKFFLSVPPKTAPLLFSDNNKKDATKSSIIPISHASSETRNLSFAGLQGLIQINAPPFNRNALKDNLFKPEISKPVLNQPPKIDLTPASEQKNVPSLFRNEKVPLFTPSPILNPPNLSESTNTEEKPTLKSSIFDFTLNNDKEPPQQFKSLDSSYKLTLQLQKEVSKEKSEEKREDVKPVIPLESCDKLSEASPFKNITDIEKTNTLKHKESETKSEKPKDSFDLLIESSSTVPLKKITDKKDNPFSLSFSSVSSKEKITPDQPCNKNVALSPENLCFTKPKKSETFDLSKTIPSILERLKKDVVADVKETESPPPQKEELNFNFLRGSQDTMKSLSRSESSNSLRICEDTSDTNDSNTDSKDLIINEKFLNTSSVVSSSASDNAVACPSEILNKPSVFKNDTCMAEPSKNPTSLINITEIKEEIKSNPKASVITTSKSPIPSTSSKSSTPPTSNKPSIIPTSSKSSTLLTSSKSSTAPTSSKSFTPLTSSKSCTPSFSSKSSTLSFSSKSSTPPTSSKSSPPTSNKSPASPLSTLKTEQKNETTAESPAIKDDNSKEIKKANELPSIKLDVPKAEPVLETKKENKTESENSTTVSVSEIKSEKLTESKNEEVKDIIKSEKSSDGKKSEKDSLFDDLLKIKSTNSHFSQSSVIMWNSETKDNTSSDEKPSATTEDKEVTDKEASSTTISDADQSKSDKDNELPIIKSTESNPSEKNYDDDLDSVDAAKEAKSEPEDEIQEDDGGTTLLSKKEAKKKRLSKKIKKFGSSEGFDKDEKEGKMKDGKSKSKKRRLESEDLDKNRDPDLKSKLKKIKKNKNKKRLGRHDDMQGEHRKEGDDDHKEISDKIKKKEKKKGDKKFFKSGIRGEFSDSKFEMKKKKGKKNRDKLSGDKKDFLEKKIKKKKKPHIEENIDTDSDKDVPHKPVDKKKKKDRKKFKAKDSSSSDDAGDKFFKEKNKNLPSSSKSLLRQDSKSDDPDMSFLLCEEKVPASPVGISHMADDTSGSSSLEENRINAAIDILPDVYPGIDNIENSDTLNKHSIDTQAVLDNTPPTTPSSTESLLSSSPSHERDSFSMNYPESTQSGRDSGEGESDIFRCNSNRTIIRGSDEYHAATTLAFAVCKSVSEKPKEEPSQNFLKRQKSEVDEHSPSKRKKKSKRVRRSSESAKSPRHKTSFSRLSKFESCCEDSSGASPATSSSPPYSNTSINFSRSPHRLSCSSESYSRYNNFYVHLHEKDPEKRIALLQDKMAALRKAYMELRSKFIQLDHKRRKARKKIREAGASNANTSTHTEDGQSCS